MPSKLHRALGATVFATSLALAIVTSAGASTPTHTARYFTPSALQCGYEGVAVRQFRHPAYTAGNTAYLSPTSANEAAFIAAVAPLAACDVFPTYALHQFARYLYPHFSAAEASYLIGLINAAYGTNL